MEQTASMFCFQCEQTAGCRSCQGKAGVCGKTAEIAGLQDQVIGTLIGLAGAADGVSPSRNTDRLVIEGLFSTLTNVNFDGEYFHKLLAQIEEEKQSLAPGCAACMARCRKSDAYDLNRLWTDKEDVRSLKSLILFGLKGMAAYAYHAQVLGHENKRVNDFFYKGLFAVGYDGYSSEELLGLAMELGEINLLCMEMLDHANRDAFGVPQPAAVPLTIEKGPFIVISGHDLYDLELLLKQTEGTGINVYTHGEMLPAHAYPKLKAYSHLKGNFGTAWQNQQKEFDQLPAPVLFTTNCLMPPKPSYRDRVFTTEVVSYPGLVHIGEEKDFTPVIEKALELGGYPEDHLVPGANGGSQVTTGFGHETILGAAEDVLKAVKQGELRHFFLVGGCDGARPGRSYFTEFVKQTPADSLILTLACGKYRFNDLDLGTIMGLPRLLDMGQCNDAYGAIRVALALSEALGCSVNDLPLTLVLSWYEQKAVCILLTLLHLGIKNIYLGPTLPAFLSPSIAEYLVKNFDLHLVGEPGEDLKNMLG